MDSVDPALVVNPVYAKHCRGQQFSGLGGPCHTYRAFQVACNWAMSCRSSHMIKPKLSSQLIGQFGHVTASASCKQPEKHGSGESSVCKALQGSAVRWTRWTLPYLVVNPVYAKHYRGQQFSGLPYLVVNPVYAKHCRGQQFGGLGGPCHT